MPSLTAVILAAGQGTRMRSELPKVLHDLCGRPLVGWPIAAALEAGADRVVVVDSAADGRWRASCRTASTCAVQPEPERHGRRRPRGRGRTSARTTPSLVLPGDVPLVTADGDRAARARRTPSTGAAATMATMMLDDPSGYGRVVRDDDGHVERVVETKVAGDATPEQLAIREVNSGDLRLRRRRAARGAARR